MVGPGNSREPSEELGELIDLSVGEVLLEELADRADVPARGDLELCRTRVRELGVHHPQVARARGSRHQPGIFETLEEPRDPRRGQRETPREVDAFQPAPLCPRKHVEGLVAVDRQAMLGLELRVQQPGGSRMRA